MSNSHFQVMPDGYVGSETYALGVTTVGPMLDQNGVLRVNVTSSSGGGSSLPGSFSTLADVSVSTSVELGSLAAANQGILVTAHPSNSAVIRIGGSNVSTSRGQPLAPGASFVFPVSNANVLYAIAETGTQTLCVAAV